MLLVTFPFAVADTMERILAMNQKILDSGIAARAPMNVRITLSC